MPFFVIALIGAWIFVPAAPNNRINNVFYTVLFGVLLTITGKAFLGYLTQGSWGLAALAFVLGPIACVWCIINRWYLWTRKDDLNA